MKRIACICGRSVLPENWSNHLLRQDGGPHQRKVAFIADVPMFAFEVPTRYGRIRVVGPASSLQAEADTQAETVARLIRLLAVDPELPLGVTVEPATGDQQ